MPITDTDIQVELNKREAGLNEIKKEQVRIDLCISSMECPNCHAYLKLVPPRFFDQFTKKVACTSCDFSWNNKWELY